MAMASKCFGKPAFSAFYGLKFKRLRVLGLDVSEGRPPGEIAGFVLIGFTMIIDDPCGGF